MRDNCQSPTQKRPLSPPDFGCREPVHHYERNVDEHKHAQVDVERYSLGDAFCSPSGPLVLVHVCQPSHVAPNRVSSSNVRCTSGHGSRREKIYVESAAISARVSCTCGIGGCGTTMRPAIPSIVWPFLLAM